MGRKDTLSLEFKSRKEKKKHKKKGKAVTNNEELERNSSVVEVGDKMGKEVVPTTYVDAAGNHTDSGERANKKKKRKREKEGDTMIVETFNNEKELLYVGERSVGKTMEKVDSTGPVKKRKKVLEDVKVGVAAEYEYDSEITNKGGDERKKAKKRKKRGKEKKQKGGGVDGEIDQNITSEDVKVSVAAEYEYDSEIINKGGDERKKAKKQKKGGKEKKQKGEGVDGEIDQNITSEDVKVSVATEYEDDSEITNKRGEKQKKYKKQKKGKKEKEKKKEKEENVDGELEHNITSDGIEAGVSSKRVDQLILENGGLSLEEGKKEKRKHRNKSGTDLWESVAEDMGADFNVENSKKGKKSKLQRHGIVEGCNVDKKKASSSKSSLKAQKGFGAPDNCEEPTPNRSLKRVSFADDVEVFSLSDGPSDEHEDLDGPSDEHEDLDGPNDKHQDLVRGKRFSKEEDKMVEEAVLRYVDEHDLGDEGLDMVLHCKSHPEVKNHPELKTCWKDIGAALPWRPFKSVYYRAHILFERAEKRKWSPEEYEEVRKFHKDNGADWKTLADKLGKHRIHVKDAWRRIKLPNLKKGQWSQDEYENLFDLVNKDLRMKVFEEKKTKHGMLRDNICWEAISETLGTRTNAICSMKWYNQLTSPLVSQKLWSDIDDYRLLDALHSLDACCIEDVDWDDLLEHRPGDVCQKRWYQMVKHIGQHALKSFPEQVEVLSKRYLADLIEAREIYANKPAVD